MNVKLKQYWFNIKNSLWFLPTLMALSAAALAFGVVKLDARVTYDELPIDWFLYGGQRDGARSVLSTIASSMVTIAGVTFSITLVALTMASSQFGPRLLRNFIADKGNQFVIGTFISTFIYSLIVLLTIRGSGEDEFVPKISVVLAFLVAVFSLGVLIYFIHHVSTSIQADYVIKSSYQDFQKIKTESMPSEERKVEQESIQEALQQIQTDYKLQTEMYLQTSGYVQRIDYEASCSWALEHNAVLEWLVYPGVFATMHHFYARVYHQAALPQKTLEKLQAFVKIDYQRTPNQDLLFPLNQIVEVGVRALSPGINDPHTAITCLHWLGAALTDIATSQLPSAILKDTNGVVSVVRRQVGYQAIVDACFDHFRVYARSNMYVAAEVLQALKKPLILTKNSEYQRALKDMATSIYKESLQEHGDQVPQVMKTDYREIMRLGS
ncbi:DUF2254 domain-containing protein [Pontibacter populi]|uniref:DUF2254 domain-containing protein n=1 Tax=Pontibacter populi TaxID=890055 RepID=A0ABV1RYL4_9BACT